MRLIIKIAIFSFLILFPVNSFCEILNTVEMHPAISFTPSEKVWLDNHPEVTLGFTSELEPLIIAEKDGGLSGILVDICDELEPLTGIKINIELGEISSTIQKAKDERRNKK